eukprot:COSAG06_NODE_36955_length_441_cov_0.681287_1_plen_79_part_10
MVMTVVLGCCLLMSLCYCAVLRYRQPQQEKERTRDVEAPETKQNDCKKWRFEAQLLFRVTFQPLRSLVTYVQITSQVGP